MTFGSTGESQRGLSVLIRGGGLGLFIASSIGNGANFLFHVAMSRVLGPATYGAFGSILGLMILVTFATAAVQAAVTQAVAEQRGDQLASFQSLSLRRKVRQGTTAGFAAFVAVAISAPVMASFLHLSSPLPPILLGVYVAVTIVALVPQGVLLGQLRFRVVAVSLVAGAGTRLAIGIALAELGYGLDGALMGSVLGAIVSLIILVVPLRREIASRHGEPLQMRFTSAILAVAGLGGFAALAGVDVFLARHYLPAAASGQYVAAATGARIALAFPSAIALVVFPQFAATRGRGEDTRRVLVVSLLAVAVLGLVAAGVILAAPHLIISVLFGNQYLGAQSALRILAVSAAGLGLICLLVYFHLARHSGRALMPWLGVLATWLVIADWHRDPAQIAWAMLIVTSITLTGLALRVLAATRSNESEYRGSVPRAILADGGSRSRHAVLSVLSKCAEFFRIPLEPSHRAPIRVENASAGDCSSGD